MSRWALLAPMQPSPLIQTDNHAIAILSPLRAYSPLGQIAQLQDIWNVICWQCDGNAVFHLTKIPEIRAPTLSSPAFIFLTGRDFDGELVPWADTSNILKSSLLGWHYPEHFVFRQSCGSVAADRHATALEAAENCCVWSPKLKHYRRGGPARPPSPAHAGFYDYPLPNPFNGELRPVLFPPAAHYREDQIVRKLHEKTVFFNGLSSDSDISTSAEESSYLSDSSSSEASPSSP